MIPPLIAIDGPAGAGKSSTAQAVAKRLGIPFLDTGALYRAAAWAVYNAGVNPSDSIAVIKIIEKSIISTIETPNGLLILVNGNDVTKAIREPVITKIVSPVCELDEVRRKLVKLQREWAARGFGVVEGRDIGTVVFPDAKLKVYITARPEIRARRRCKDLGLLDDPDTILKITKEITERDRRDSERPNSPLKKADDAILLDNSDISFKEQVDFILKHAAKRFGIRLYTIR